MERNCSTVQSPKQAVAPMEKEVVLPVVDVFHVPYFEFPTSDGCTRKFKKKIR
jgi:hypothetical protein